MIFPATEMRLPGLWFLGSSFLVFLKMGVVFPFFQLPVTLPWLFNYDGDCLGNSISQFPQDSGIYLIRSHRLEDIQLHPVV